MGKRRSFSAQFKAKVALEALVGRRSDDGGAGYTYIPNAARFPLPGGDHVLGDAPGAFVAAVQHPGWCLLPGGPSGGAGRLRKAGNLQHQGSQSTSREFTGILERAGVEISMDGKGRWRGNVFIERLWRSLKYECVYLPRLRGWTASASDSR